MTTIKIKNAAKLSQTSFENLEELTEYLYNIYLEEELPPLSAAEIDEAELARKNLKKDPKSFSRSISR